MKKNKLKTILNLFENTTIKSIWIVDKEEYYFSVIDIIAALTESDNPSLLENIKIKNDERRK